MHEHLQQEVGIYVYGKGNERVNGSMKEMRILTGKLALSHRKSSWGELLVCFWERHLGDKNKTPRRDKTPKKLQVKSK